MNNAAKNMFAHVIFGEKKCIYSFTSLGHILMGGFGRSYDNNTVSPPLMLSIGSVTLSKTKYNKTNFTTG